MCFHERAVGSVGGLPKRFIFGPRQLVISVESSDIAYLQNDVYPDTYPGIFMNNHSVEKRAPTLSDFQAASSKTQYVRNNLEGVNSLYLNGSIAWKTSSELTHYALPGSGVVGALLFPKDGPGRIEIP